MAISSIAEAIEDIKAGKFIIIVDDEDRENEGDLAMAAEKVSADAINFMTLYARGLICLPIIGSRLDELRDSVNGKGKHVKIFYRLHRVN